MLGILSKNRYKVPTPIQQQCIPFAIKKDVIGIAQTGTGKTLAFGIRLYNRCTERWKNLIVVPTRELAIQVARALETIASPRRDRVSRHKRK